MALHAISGYTDFFTMEGPPVYISFPETYNGVFQLQSHQFEPVLCPIS